MATAINDSDVDRSIEQDGDECCTDHPAYDKSEDKVSQEPGMKPQSSHSRKQTERTNRVTETETEQLRGLDDLTTCINSVDDYVQAGLLELRNCVANLSKERTIASNRIHTLTEEVHQISVERDHYQLAVGELQQEVALLREQLCNHQKEKDALFIRVQDIEHRNEEHLANIAGKQRCQRLAHKAISRWRRKTYDRKLECRQQIHLLEEENKDLRAELLLCQEAAKQAFLRSANALNSEALTMFQDAATRRLGFDEVRSQENQSPQILSSSNSPDACTHVNQNSSNAETGENKKVNFGTHKEDSSRTQGRIHLDIRRGIGNEGGSESDDSRSFIATYGSDDQINPHSFHRGQLSVDASQRGRGTFTGRSNYEFDPHRLPDLRPSGLYSYSFPSGGVGAVEGQLSSQNRLINSFDPDALQQESRAYLQQLREERRRRPDPGATSGFESQSKSQKMAASQVDSKRKTCSCKSRKSTVESQGPYKCPYCTPVQNSNFGHAKEVKKNSNSTRSNVISGITKGRKVHYTPSASTIVIEKHVTR